MTTRPPERLVTDLCVVRRMTEADAESWKDAVDRSIEHLRPWMPWIKDEPMSLEARRELLATWSAEWDEDKEYPYGIEVDGAIVGSTGLHRRGDTGTLEIGYWIAVDFVGRGIATASSRALTETAMSLEGVDAVEIVHDVANVTSGRIPEKLGYRLVSTEEREPSAPGESGKFNRWRYERPK